MYNRHLQEFIKESKEMKIKPEFTVHSSGGLTTLRFEFYDRVSSSYDAACSIVFQKSNTRKRYYILHDGETVKDMAQMEYNPEDHVNIQWQYESLLEEAHRFYLECIGN